MPVVRSRIVWVVIVLCLLGTALELSLRLGPRQPGPTWRALNLERIGWIGISFDGVLDSQATYGVPDAVRVTRVVQDGPADRAGIAVDDVIVGLDGRPFVDGNELQSRVAMKKPGDTISLELVRDSQRHTLQMRLATYDEVVRKSRSTPGDGLGL